MISLGNSPKIDLKFKKKVLERIRKMTEFITITDQNLFEILRGVLKSSSPNYRFTAYNASSATCPFFIAPSYLTEYSLSDLVKQPPKFWDYAFDKYPLLTEAVKAKLLTWLLSGDNNF